MTPTGIWVFTPYGKGEVLSTRNDGIIQVQLTTSQGRHYLGYFHLSQVRQLNNHEAGANQNDAMDTNNGGGGGGARVCGLKRGAVDDGEQAAQRVRGPVPFTDMVNHMQH